MSQGGLMALTRMPRVSPKVAARMKPSAPAYDMTL
jgi:hypothetical protein